jgi:Tol biopolymer transport system component
MARLRGRGQAQEVWVSADGSGKPEELALRTEWWIGDNVSVAPDGRLALVRVQNERGYDLYLLSLDTRHTLEPFLATPATESEPAISPSGRFVAYASNESGRVEVYVRPFPKLGRKWTVSTGGGSVPVWRRDESELFYLHGNSLMVVPVHSGTELTIGSPQVLFEMTSALSSSAFAFSYDVTADGQRFLMVEREPREEAPLQIVVIPDFVEEMKARLAAGRK